MIEMDTSYQYTSRCQQKHDPMAASVVHESFYGPFPNVRGNWLQEAMHRTDQKRSQPVTSNRSNSEHQHNQ